MGRPHGFATKAPGTNGCGPQKRERAASAGLCIVVAEDDGLLRYCTVELLKREGYKVIEASDGVEALELLEKCEEAVHPLVTNYDMPRMNGREPARHLRAKHKRLELLLISGSNADFDGADNLERLPKPYNEAELAKKG